MHETMMNCLHKEDPTSKKQISATEKAAHQEVKELQEQKKRMADDFEMRSNQLKELLEEKEKKNKDLENRIEKLINDKFQNQY